MVGMPNTTAIDMYTVFECPENIPFLFQDPRSLRSSLAADIDLDKGLLGSAEDSAINIFICLKYYSSSEYPA